MFIIRDREAGNFIDMFGTYEAAEEALKAYEDSDKAEGIYEEGFYEIVEDKPEECYFIEDDCTTSSAICDTIILTATTEAEALREAWARWNRLSTHDQRKRDSFCLCCEYDGDVDYVIDIVEAAPVYAAFDRDVADIRNELEDEMAFGYRQSMDADLDLRIQVLKDEYREQYPDLF